MPNSEFSLPVAFHFSVQMEKDTSETAFQEVQGVDSQMETDAIRGGGENSYLYYLPKKISHSDLVLKRALAPRNSGFYIWCKRNLENTGSFKIITHLLLVCLLNEKNETLSSWTFENAYPVKWTLGNLDAMKNEILIENITFKYSSMKRG